MISVLIADDHAVVRTGLRSIIAAESDMKLIGEATCGRDAISMAIHEQPDVMILDISMPDIDGLVVTKQVKERLPDLHVLVLTVHEDEALLKAAIQAGASGYLLKRAAESELITAIHKVRRGDLHVDPSLIRALLAEPGPVRSPSRVQSHVLTPREVDVLRLIAFGHTNRQVGMKLSISVRTVESHRASLSSKLGLKSRVDLVRYARDNGIAE